MKSWLASILLGFLVVGAVAALIVARTQGQKPPTALVQAGEYIEGLKRAPGTWKDASINVGASKESLGAPDVTVEIQVMRPLFVPNEVRVKQGQVVRLRLLGKDNGLADMPELQGNLGLKEFSGHGFQILGPYDVWITGIRKDEVKEITFRASEAGEFPFECVVFCHPSHYLMQGKLIVEPR